MLILIKYMQNNDITFTNASLTKKKKEKRKTSFLLTSVWYKKFSKQELEN